MSALFIGDTAAHTQGPRGQHGGCQGHSDGRYPGSTESSVVRTGQRRRLQMVRQVSGTHHLASIAHVLVMTRCGVQGVCRERFRSGGPRVGLGSGSEVDVTFQKAGARSRTRHPAVPVAQREVDVALGTHALRQSLLKPPLRGAWGPRKAGASITATVATFRDPGCLASSRHIVCLPCLRLNTSLAARSPLPHRARHETAAQGTSQRAQTRGVQLIIQPRLPQPKPGFAPVETQYSASSSRGRKVRAAQHVGSQGRAQIVQSCSTGCSKACSRALVPSICCQAHLTRAWHQQKQHRHDRIQKAAGSRRSCQPGQCFREGWV